MVLRDDLENCNYFMHMFSNVTGVVNVSPRKFYLSKKRILVKGSAKETCLKNRSQIHGGE